MEELARRAVACKYWRWMPGMLTDDGVRVLEFENASVWAEPDLTDPATLGCLLTLVRDAYGEFITTARVHGQWVVTTGTFGFWNTEAEALVAALEAAD